jgi:hypothetical protein
VTVTKPSADVVAMKQGKRHRATFARSKCPRCGRPIEIGQMLERVYPVGATVWAHEGCVPAEPAAYSPEALERFPSLSREEGNGELPARDDAADCAAVVSQAVEFVTQPEKPAEVGPADPEAVARLVMEKMGVDIAQAAAIAAQRVAETLTDSVGKAILGDVLEAVNAKCRQLAVTLAEHVDTRLDKLMVPKVVLLKSETTERVIDGVTHAAFPRVLQLAAARCNIFLPGPSGCGKTHLSRQVADALGLEFGIISFSEGVSETKIVGRVLPNLSTGQSVYEPSEFVTRFEQGGVMLLDEIDSADANVLLKINSAIGNGYLALDRQENPIASRHADFVCIAAGNTFGHGADMEYTGRTRLDMATLDRFRIGTVPMDYDPELEKTLCPDADLRKVLQGWRAKIREHGIRGRILSSRFLQDAYRMTQVASWTLREIEEAYFAGWKRDEKLKVLGRS